MTILPTPATNAAFCAAAIALILTPGLDTIYVLTLRVQSRGAGLTSALGIATGVLPTPPRRRSASRRCSGRSRRPAVP